MIRTLITGAGGFTGRYVAALLADRGHEVHGIVHGEPAEPVPSVSRLHVGDLCDLPRAREIVEEVQPDHVLHLAAIAFVAHSDIEQMYLSNIVGTRQLLEALAEGPRVPRSIIVASSANVYGNSREGVLDEGMSLAPANDYGVSKVAVEYVASIYRPRLPIIVTRPFNYTGRGQSSDFIIPKIVAHARKRAPFIELGNLDVARDFSDVRDVAEIYARLLSQPEAVGQTLNICSGRAVTLRDVIELVWRLSDYRFEVRVDPALIRSNEVRTLHGSPARLESTIGCTPSIPLEETLHWMLAD